MTKYVRISQDIAAPLSQVFDWFYHSENFTASPIVFQSRWKSKERWEAGSIRDIIMIAGWYQEEITAVAPQKFIRYKVNRSFPKVRQDFTEISFEKLENAQMRVTWIIEVEVTPAFLTGLGGKMAATLYGTIITAAKKSLEASFENQ